MATYDELRTVLQHHHAAILDELHVRQANMWIPVDGKGLRIHVSADAPAGSAFPEHVSVRLHDGRLIDVPLEVTTDYQRAELR